MTMMAGLLKPTFTPPPRDVRLVEVIVGSQSRGRTIADLSAALPADVRIVIVRHEGMNVPPAAHTRLQHGDGVLLVGSPASLESVARVVLHVLQRLGAPP